LIIEGLNYYCCYCYCCFVVGRVVGVGVVGVGGIGVSVGLDLGLAAPTAATSCPF